MASEKQFAPYLNTNVIAFDIKIAMKQHLKHNCTFSLQADMDAHHF